MTKGRKHFTICPNCGTETVFCAKCGWQSTDATPFSDWLRKQEEIDSKNGYISTNIDYMWENYKTGEWMLIEEKRNMGEPSWSQREQFKKIHKGLIDAPGYKGIHLIQFEKTSPGDGNIYLDHHKISKDELINFLLMQADRQPPCVHK